MSVEWSEADVSCARCGSPATVRQASGGKLTIPPPGWIVGDTFPPGDAGPALLCSEPCAEAWLAAELASWERP